MSALLLVAALALQDLIVERVADLDPPRVTVRCEVAGARRIVLAVAAACGLDATSVPAEMDGPVGPVSLLAVDPEDAIERVAGAIGWSAAAPRNIVRVEKLPGTKEPGARERLRREAVVQLERFLAESPNDEHMPRALLELAALHEEGLEADSALEALRTLREGRPDSPEAVPAAVALARLRIDSEQYVEAMRELYEVTEHHATHPAAAEAEALLGRCKLRMGSPELAERYFDLCIERFPGTVAALSARIWRVEALRQLARMDEVRREIAALEALDLPLPRAIELLEVRALAAETTAEFSDAAEGWLALAATTTHPGRRARRLLSAAEAARRAGDRTAELLARLAAESGPKDEAIANWLVDFGAADLAVSRRGNDAATRIRAAQEHLSRGETEAARRLLDTLEPSSERALLEAEAAMQLREYAKVPSILARSIDASPDPQFVNRALRILGDAYLASGDVVRAAQSYRGIIPPEALR